MNRIPWSLKLFGICILVVVGAAGCGSSGGSGSSSSSADTTSTTASSEPEGEPLKISVTSTVGTAIQDIPQIWGGAKAAARYINEHGGIQGHPVQIETCNGKSDPNIEVQCAQKAADEDAIAAVGTLATANPEGFEDILEKNDIAEIGAVTTVPIEVSAPNTFPLDFNFGAYAACASSQLAKLANSEKVGSAAIDIPLATTVGEDVVSQAAENQGTEFVGAVRVPVTASDLSPYVQQIAEKEPGIVAVPLAPTQLGAFFTSAAGQGYDWTYCGAEGQASFAVLAKLGAVAENYYVGANYPPLSAADEYPFLEEFKEQMQAEAEAGDEDASLDYQNYNINALKAWLGMQVVKQVADEMKGPINAETFLKAISSSQSVDIGLERPFDFAKPFGKEPYPRVFRDELYLSRWSPEKKDFELVDKKPISGMEAFFGVKPPAGG